MLTPPVRTLAAALSFGLLAACNIGGSGGGKKPDPAGTASLTVNIAGLPAEVPASVKVTGPKSYSHDLSTTMTLAALTGGDYTITANSLISGTVSYVASAPVQSATVADKGSASVTVTYAPTKITLALQEVATVPGAVFLTSPVADARQFVVEKTGRIRILQNGTLLATPFLDISRRVSIAGEGGLLSMAFHPQYASNGLFYIYFSDTGGNIIVERRKVSSNANVAIDNDALEIIRIAHPNETNHYGGLLSFGPDGFLYIGTGDGGGLGDPHGNGQNQNSLLGKLLRLDVANAGTGQTYTIPSTNPNVGQSGKRGEIWASGLRNPWRYTFDTSTSKLYIADVGQDKREEVDIADVTKAGNNYGWNAMEGTACFMQGCNQTALTLPVFDYEHSQSNGCSIIGGYVYRGKAMPELAGRYFYSDYCNGYLKSFFYNANAVTEQIDWNITKLDKVQSFGRDADGELYLIAGDGKIYRITKTKP